MSPGARRLCSPPICRCGFCGTRGIGDPEVGLRLAAERDRRRREADVWRRERAPRESSQASGTPPTSAPRVLGESAEAIRDTEGGEGLESLQPERRETAPDLLTRKQVPGE